MVYRCYWSFTKKISIGGCRLQAQLKGNAIALSLGYFSPSRAHFAVVGITAECPSQTEIVLKVRTNS